MILYFLGGLVVLVIIWFISTYNKLVVLRNRVKNSWAQIDVQLKRRFDLIPNVIETVKGYAAHERQTFDSVTAARARMGSAANPTEAMAANAELTQALGRLFAVAEAYPELKANTNFLQLQDELSRTEDKIGYSRQFYNDTALKYNNSLQTFPTVLIAGNFGFQEEAFFATGGAEREAPQVRF